MKILMLVLRRNTRPSNKRIDLFDFDKKNEYGSNITTRFQRDLPILRTVRAIRYSFTFISRNTD